jgi:GNAT superfamily N-acetyltransferase
MTDEIEAVERAALENLHEAATAELRAQLGIESDTAGSGFLSLARALPASAIVVNRTIGLGVGTAETRDTVEAVVARYRAAGVLRYFIHLHPESRPSDMAEWLTGLGLERARGWMKFRRGRAAPPEAGSTLEIRTATAADAEAFGRIECHAFDLGPAAAPWMGRLIGSPGWHIYMSFDGGTPAGAGALFVSGGVGWCDWGATTPDFRGRGSQSALLRRRILDALDLGCRLLVTTTGEEVPGDPQHSYKNILRMGFEPAYVRQNYAPPKPS